MDVTCKDRVVATADANGRLFVGDTNIEFTTKCKMNPAVLRPRVLQKLNLPQSSRLIQCEQCKAWFIGHYLARLCSIDCVEQARLQVQKHHTEVKLNARKNKRLCLPDVMPVKGEFDDVLDHFFPWNRYIERAKYFPKCKECGITLEHAERSTMQYCEGACRQKGYLKRKLAATASVPPPI